MNFCRGRRKAITPVLATVILIAITLIAAVAISGFVFGLFGNYTNVARVSAATITCTGTPEVCTAQVQNTGSANAELTGSCTMTFAGASYSGVATLTSGSLQAGSPLATVTCTGPAGSHANLGSQIVGAILLTDGAQILFSAVGN